MGIMPYPRLPVKRTEAEMTDEEMENAVSGFFAALGLTIQELGEIPGEQDIKQFFLDRLSHFVRRVTREQPQIGTITEDDAEKILRLHQMLLEGLPQH